MVRVEGIERGKNVEIVEGALLNNLNALNTLPPQPPRNTASIFFAAW